MRLVRPCQHDEELLAIQTFVLQRVMSILCRIGCDHGSWLRSALLESFLLFVLILRPLGKDPEAHEGVRENRTTGYSHEFGGVAPQRGIRNQRLQDLPCKPYQTIALQDFDLQT